MLDKTAREHYLDDIAAVTVACAPPDILLGLLVWNCTLEVVYHYGSVILIELGVLDSNILKVPDCIERCVTE